jgi:type II secretory pathway component PulF
MAINSEIISHPLLGQIFRSGSFDSNGEMLFRLVVGAIGFLLWAGGMAGVIFLIHFGLTLPMRRVERARLFLDLLENALNRGQAAEQMILSLAQNRDQSMGVRFHLLAAYIESGLPFLAALHRVPRFLPSQIFAMLRAGEKIGDLQRVLPACREILQDRPAAVRSAVHYMILVILFFSPVFVGVATMITVFVVPRFKGVAAGSNARLWPVTQFVFDHTAWLVDFEIVLFLFLAVVTCLYVGGQRLARWFQFRRWPFVDWIAWKIPWKHKRLQRTFSAMLAVLLDGGVSEFEAVRLAGDCTANDVCRQRAARIIVALERGTKLDEAVRSFDNQGEFRWRLTNVAHARSGFLDALRGWHEALDAQAFQQEQAAAHAVTSGLVIMNGLVVALITTATFGLLVAMLNAMLSTL